jgi:hypothetical protein
MLQSISRLNSLMIQVSKQFIDTVQSMSQYLLRQELSVCQILRTYGKQFKQIRNQYSMYLTEDVISVSSCHTMGGLVKKTLMQQQDYWLH